MDNVIKIKTSQTDSRIEACLEMNKNIHVAVYEQYKGDTPTRSPAERLSQLAAREMNKKHPAEGGTITIGRAGI